MLLAVCCINEDKTVVRVDEEFKNKTIAKSTLRERGYKIRFIATPETYEQAYNEWSSKNQQKKDDMQKRRAEESGEKDFNGLNLKGVSTKKCNYIAFILYPENLEHMQLFDWLCRKQKMIFIEHQPEPLTAEDGETEYTEDCEIKMCKKHMHCVVFFENKHSPRSFVKSCCGVLKYAEAVSDISSYGLYMVHKNFACERAKKLEYKYSDVLYTSKELYQRVYDSSCDNDVVSFAVPAVRFLDLCCQFSTFTQLVRYCAKNDRDLLHYIESKFNFCKALFEENMKYDTFNEVKNCNDVLSEVKQNQAECELGMTLDTACKLRIHTFKEHLKADCLQGHNAGTDALLNTARTVCDKYENSKTERKNEK